jgi:adenosylcobinamide-phosphate synthase
MPFDVSPQFIALMLAFVVEALLGDYPNVVHPVHWLGQCISGLLVLTRRVVQPRAQLLVGGLFALGVPGVCAGLVFVSERCFSFHPLVGWLLSIYVLKSTFALRSLGTSAMDMQVFLAVSSMGPARRNLSWLCSRDPSGMTTTQLVAATIESVAENASDSLVAPLFYYLLFGLEGAVFYRAVNTLDAMIGYRGRFEYVGKAAARLDDVMNWVPARLCTFWLLLAGWLDRQDVRQAIRILWRDGKNTKSPNAGRPMAAMAGLLNVQLEKPNHYRLGDANNELSASLITTAWHTAALGCSMMATSVLAVLLVR